MNSNIEFEIKAKIGSLAQVSNLIDNARPMGRPIAQSDVYYDTTDRRLYRSAVFLRLRNDSLVEIKAAPPSAGTGHFWCNEIRVPLSGSSNEFEQIGDLLRSYVNPVESSCRNFAELTTAFELEPLVEVSKERTVYQLDGAELAIDSVRKLGLFVELEVHDPAHRQQYLRLVEESRLVHISVGYVELLLRMLEPRTYLQGRYLLPEDRLENLPAGSGSLDPLGNTLLKQH